MLVPGDRITLVQVDRKGRTGGDGKADDARHLSWLTLLQIDNVGSARYRLHPGRRLRRAGRRPGDGWYNDEASRSCCCNRRGPALMAHPAQGAKSRFALGYLVVRPSLVVVLSRSRQRPTRSSRRPSTWSCYQLRSKVPRSWCYYRRAERMSWGAPLPIMTYPGPGPPTRRAILQAVCYSSAI